MNNCCYGISIAILTLMFNKGICLLVSGDVKTIEDWAFMARFCYQSDEGEVVYNFDFPEDTCCPEVILYFDSQWNDVYPQPEMTCEEKRDVTVAENHQILYLNVFSSSNCTRVVEHGEKLISCYGSRKIRASRARWWYIVLAKCNSKTGVQMKYRLEMTNGKSFWTRHFSADEKNILETDLIFCCLTVIVICFLVYTSYILRKRQLLHTTYKMFINVVLFEMLSIVMNIVHYMGYGEMGVPSIGLKTLARGMHGISETILVVLLILLGKGFTITRGRISPLGQVKLSVFCTFYAIAYIALFIFEAKAFDPASVLYIYESPAGVGICVLRILGWLWFCYGIFFTLKNYANKRLFYYPFWVFYTLWFLSAPLVVLLASYAFEPYVRAQVMNAVDRTVALLSSVFFLVLTRPSQANTNFPYHVRTSQIGIMEEQNPDSNDDFNHHTYAPSSDDYGVKNKNITVLFSVYNSDGSAQDPVAISKALDIARQVSQNNSVNLSSSHNRNINLSSSYNHPHHDNNNRQFSSINREQARSNHPTNNYRPNNNNNNNLSAPAHSNSLSASHFTASSNNSHRDSHPPIIDRPFSSAQPTTGLDKSKFAYDSYPHAQYARNEVSPTRKVSIESRETPSRDGLPEFSAEPSPRGLLNADMTPIRSPDIPVIRSPEVIRSPQIPEVKIRSPSVDKDTPEANSRDNKISSPQNDEQIEQTIPETESKRKKSKKKNKKQNLRPLKAPAKLPRL